MADNGFVIKNGVLKKYTGKGGDVTIPGSVTEIGDWAFCGFTSLTSVTIPDSVTSIGWRAFYGCTWLTSVTIPDSATSIGDWAFNGCTRLTSVTIGNSVTSIGYAAFWGCESLTSVTIPDSVTSIGRYAFGDCKSLQCNTFDNALYLGNSQNPYIVLIHEKNNNISSVKIHTSAKFIYSYAFVVCTKLTDVVIPDSVTSIGEGAFEGCKSLTSVTIGNGVTSIGDLAFQGCKKLKHIAIKGNKQIIKEAAFDYGFLCSFDKTVEDWHLHLTDGALKRYILADRWDTFNDEERALVYMNRQSKTLEKSYLKVIKDPERLGEAILEKMQENASATECSAAANLMICYYADVSPELLKRMYERLRSLKNGKKALQKINECNDLLAVLNGAAETGQYSMAGQLVNGFMMASGVSKKQLENLLNLLGLAFSDLPELLCTDQTPAEPFVLAWLLTQNLKQGTDVRRAVITDTGNPDQIHEVRKSIDERSFQNALWTLADQILVKYQNTNKKYFAYPFCRYADEASMAEMTKRAPGWRTAVSGLNAPPLWEFRQGALYSDTRAAMLFADKYGDLDEYAKMRGKTADDLRDRYMCDTGLDEKRGKTYDLGNQTVTARLQKDLSFIFVLSDGKTAKSLPKKGADPAKYEAANKDFTELKKSVKKILKNRFDRLFEDFLGGRSRDAESWKEAYLHNPVLRDAAQRLVWAQGKKTFTLTDDRVIDEKGKDYVIAKGPIKVAHPMELEPGITAKWQNYFAVNAIKQPFAQVWEPVRDPATIKSDRYTGCMIPYYRFTGRQKHGITVEDYDYHNEIYISLKGCKAEIERIDWKRHEIEPNDCFEIKSFTSKGYTRQVNHLVAYFDRVTVWDRVRKDDISVAELLDSFTLAQIVEFIGAAQEANATNVLALLLDYKNKRYPDADPYAELTLDW